MTAQRQAVLTGVAWLRAQQSKAPGHFGNNNGFPATQQLATLALARIDRQSKNPPIKRNAALGIRLNLVFLDALEATYRTAKPRDPNHKPGIVAFTCEPKYRTDLVVGRNSRKARIHRWRDILGQLEEHIVFAGLAVSATRRVAFGRP